jgi:hypothetical protein
VRAQPGASTSFVENSKDHGKVEHTNRHCEIYAVAKILSLLLNTFKGLQIVNWERQWSFTVTDRHTIGSVRQFEGFTTYSADAAALQAVKNAAPFGPLPAGSKETVDIQFTFDYNVSMVADTVHPVLSDADIAIGDCPW